MLVGNEEERAPGKSAEQRGCSRLSSSRSVLRNSAVELKHAYSDHPLPPAPWPAQGGGVAGVGH